MPFSPTHQIIVLALGLITLLTTASVAPNPLSDPLAAEQARFAAMVSKDTAALRKTLHPELLYIHSNGLEESATDLVVSVASGKVVYQSFEPVRNPQMRIFEETALVDGLVKVTGVFEGKDFSVDLRYTSVYRLENEQWRLIRWQSLRV